MSSNDVYTDITPKKWAQVVECLYAYVLLEI